MAFFLKDYKTMIEKSAIENAFQVLVVLSAVLEALLFLFQSMGFLVAVPQVATRK